MKINGNFVKWSLPVKVLIGEGVIEESVVTYPTESQNKFAFKIFKYFSEKKKGLVKFNIFKLLSKLYYYLK